MLSLKIINESEITELEERTVTCVSFVGNYVGKVEVFAELFGKLGNWAGPKQLMGHDTLFVSAHYGNSIYPLRDLKLLGKGGWLKYENF